MRRTTLAIFSIILTFQCSVTDRARGAVVEQTIGAIAIQDVNLLGIDATLVHPGFFEFRIDIGTDGNSSSGGGTSATTGFFQGFLPDEFTPLGISGFPFDVGNDTSIFSIPDETTTVTDGGMTVAVSSHFWLQVFDPTRTTVLATFHTDFANGGPGLFQAVNTEVPIPIGTLFEDPNRPNDVLQIVAGPNQIGINEGEIVGTSFNRTIVTVPEPSSLFVLFAMTSSLALFRKRTRV